MPAINTLSDKAVKAAIKTAGTAGKARKLSDGGGLVLEARPNGAGWWRLRYWLAGKEGMLSLGAYPEVPLALARERRDEARRLVADGIDPSDARKADKAARAAQREAQALAEAGLPGPGTFEHAAREWHAYMAPSWSAGHAAKVLALLENDLIPFIGARPLAELTPPELLTHARRVEARGATETAYRALKAAGAVFRYGVQHGYCTSDPTRDLKGAIQLPVPEHRAAVTDPAKLGELLRAIDGYHGTPVVRAALQLAPLVFLRPGELRKAEWAEFDLDGGTWTVPAARMKGRLKSKLNGPDHLVPLAPQAVAILRELHPLTGSGKYVFPSPLTAERPLSDNGVLSALRRMGFGPDEVTGHGFRATARTIAAERLGVAPEVIEAQLAHRVPDALGRAYNRTLFLEQRRELMTKWADYLDRLRRGAQVTPLQAA
ncbi:MAG: integrase arm-type DNA-binding domain-containing protein [Burkholderiales bacterium]|nr:integrase arm-type DNA-binding domain-containing protein [Burkholderiales bacterium]